jgi:2-methylisocitrate lyase-like PEP mutase family enzyme
VTAGPADKAAVLLTLHAGPGFVLPNAWDAGSARILEQVGFPAIATTSAGIAWSCGVPDGQALDRDTMLEHVARIVAAVGVPVTADLEAGYGDSPEEVGRTVARAAELGVVGANVEDAREGRLLDVDEAAERIAAARSAAPHGSFVLNARTDTYFGGATGDVFTETVARAQRYVDAGADCIFVPGVVEEDTIRRLAAEIPGPMNIVAGLANTIDVPTLFSLGVTRVSLGGSLARASLSMLERAGRELLDTGTLGFLDGALGYADLQQRFGLSRGEPTEGSRHSPPCSSPRETLGKGLPAAEPRPYPDSGEWLRGMSSTRPCVPDRELPSSCGR